MIRFYIPPEEIRLLVTAVISWWMVQCKRQGSKKEAERRGVLPIREVVTLLYHLSNKKRHAVLFVIDEDGLGVTWWWCELYTNLYEADQFLLFCFFLPFDTFTLFLL